MFGEFCVCILTQLLERLGRLWVNIAMMFPNDFLLKVSIRDKFESKFSTLWRKICCQSTILVQLTFLEKSMFKHMFH
jgi:hypothetical protein